jgi:hypothetical protein
MVYVGGNKQIILEDTILFITNNQIYVELRLFSIFCSRNSKIICTTNKRPISSVTLALFFALCCIGTIKCNVPIAVRSIHLGVSGCFSVHPWGLGRPLLVAIHLWPAVWGVKMKIAPFFNNEGDGGFTLWWNDTASCIYLNWYLYK